MRPPQNPETKETEKKKETNSGLFGDPSLSLASGNSSLANPPSHLRQFSAIARSRFSLCRLRQAQPVLGPVCHGTSSCFFFHVVSLVLLVLVWFVFFGFIFFGFERGRCGERDVERCGERCGWVGCSWVGWVGCSWVGLGLVFWVFSVRCVRFVSWSYVSWSY